MRTISLELLRRGPPHNQLLSPLTQYLALCENHAAFDVQVPFEHNQFLHRLRALGYEADEDSRTFQILDTAKVLGRLLAVPGLIAELNREHAECTARGTQAPSTQRMTHLRLVVSASELALLPFETALAPDGLPGAGQHVLLQSQEPICLTREVRRVAEQHVYWPDDPKILFVSASPPGLDPVPVEAHLLALRKEIDPWVGPDGAEKQQDQGRSSEEEKEREEKRRERIGKYLQILPNATVDSFQRVCAEGNFSHIHILAHGVQYRDGFDRRFGIAFHNSASADGPMDKVSGVRLATILRSVRRPNREGLARPVVVTLATCNASNVGSVAGAGASVAHALHEAGVPMVVASQFPLSFAGSVLMVEVLYNGLLWGHDPRITLNDVRRRLHAELPRTHDWASLTAYLSLPAEFEKRIADVHFRQVDRSINVAMHHADNAVNDAWEGRRKPDANPAALKALLEVTLERVERARDRLAGLLARAADDKARAKFHGRLASTEKRLAELRYWSRPDLKSGESTRPPPDVEAVTRKHLREAESHYAQAFRLDHSNGWGVVQRLSLKVVLVGGVAASVPANTATDFNEDAEAARPESLWTLAHVLSTTELRESNGGEERDAWAHGDLLELYLLGLVIPAVTARFQVAALVTHAIDHARQLVVRAGKDSFQVYSTWRQLRRYVDWYQSIAPQTIGPMVQAVNQVLAELPEPTKFVWY